MASGKIAANRKRKLIQETTFTVGQKQFNLAVCCGVNELSVEDTKEKVLNRLQSALKKAKDDPKKKTNGGFSLTSLVCLDQKELL